MKVQVRMDDVSISLGNKGILLKISDNAGKHVGDLRIGKANVEWMKGRTHEGNGKKVRVDQLIQLLSDE
ncbi:hypothetical protein [Streptomyces alboflavus]|uniref:hypothetical protein n=1 Tax=Streptomyces alboflavus TaxID=67267 RepID=UPI0036810ECF